VYWFVLLQLHIVHEESTLAADDNIRIEKQEAQLSQWETLARGYEKQLCLDLEPLCSVDTGV